MHFRMGENLEVRGLEYEEKAEKKLKSWGILGSKYEDASDLLEKAGNSYKLAKACVFSFFISATCADLNFCRLSRFYQCFLREDAVGN